MKRILLIILYNTAAVILLFLVLEFLVRIFVPGIRLQGTDVSLFEDNIYYSSAGLKPNTSGVSNGAMIYTDKYGFRKNRTSFDKTKKSILLLGDSVTMGIGIETDSTFSSILQDSLESPNILNPSMFGYNIQDYKNLLNYFLSKGELQITHVVICWCLNDIYDKSINAFEVPGRSIRYFFGDILSWLSNSSCLYTYIKTLVSDRSKGYYIFDSKLYRNKKLLERSVFILNEMKMKCRESRIQFSVLLLPYEYQLRVNKPYPLIILEKSLTENGIEVINAFPFFKNQNINSKSFYLYGDGIHFSNAGHKVIAAALYRDLKN
ncbi:MAG TPA: SGNH/GDSL hydrolase family protein [Ignavibacteriaceae bacterium]|nr:SGNH/GDSL hydrolase family protein [Ignavibacteriaceae bacterium]